MLIIMGLAEPKVKGKTIAKSWQAQRFREKMLNTSITQAPTLAIGLNMMSKMGWQDGQGLGASKQGIIEPIQLKHTINNKGLGYSCVTGLEQVHYSAHFERFESVLASLANKDQTDPPEQNATSEDNKTNTTKAKKQIKASNLPASEGNISEKDKCNSKKESPSVDASGPLKKHIKQSLEGLSRRVRGRVHYQKFTRGKDVSRYTEDDLACILGAKAHTLYTAGTKHQGEDDGKFVFGSKDSKAYFSGLSSPSGTPNESRSASDTDEPKTFTPSFPLNNALSDEEEQDSRPSFGGLGFGAAAGDDETSSERPAFGGAGNSGGDDAVQKCFQDRFAAKYMSAFVKADEGLTGTIKMESKDEENSPEDFSNTDKNAGSESVDGEVREVKKKRKKNKSKVSDDSQPELGEDSVPKKKKKKSRKETDFTEDCSVLPSEKECKTERDDAPGEEKSKKNIKVSENSSKCSVNIENEDVESRSEKKKKKKRKREEADDLSIVCDGINHHAFGQETSNDVSATKKKKSKRKSKSTCIEIEEDMRDNLIGESIVEECQTNTDQERKKKKKKKSSS